MTVALRHVLRQGPMIATLGRTAAMAALGSPKAVSSHAAPGPWVEARVAPPPADLVRDYIRHVGGDPAWYRGRLPYHLFPQWGLPLAARALAPLGYPVTRAMNAGCRIENRAPLPAGEVLQVRARVESVDDDGHRAIVTQRIVTSTRSAQEAVVADARVFIRLRERKDAASGRSTRAAALVPGEAREVAFTRIGARAGLDFAKLTGDFNPVHWVARYARAAGFRGCILHGFSTLARAIEALHRARFAGDPSRLALVDARLLAPLTLPASVGVYLTDDARFWIGDAPDGRAYLEGHYRTATGR